MDDRIDIPDDLRREMRATFLRESDAREWLERPVPALEGATPAALIRSGRADEVLAVLRVLNLGNAL